MFASNPLASFEEFLDACTQFELRRAKTVLYKQLQHNILPFNYSIPFVSGIVNYSDNSYLHLSENLVYLFGYSASRISSPSCFRERVTDHSWKLLDRQVFPAILRFLSAQKSEDYEKYRFVFNYDFYKADGTMATVVQYSTFSYPVENGIPLINLCFVQELYGMPSGDLIYFTVEQLDANLKFIPVMKQIYRNVPHGLTAREQEILQLSYRGLSTKMIAGNFQISPNTVRNHKKNMMEKTGTQSIIELIHFALQHSLLDLKEGESGGKE